MKKSQNLTIVVNNGDLVDGDVAKGDMFMAPVFLWWDGQLDEEELIWFPLEVVDNLNVDLSKFLVLGE